MEDKPEDVLVAKRVAKKAKRKNRLITDAVVDKILKKSGPSIRMSGAAKRVLKSALVTKGLVYFKRGDKVRQAQNMSTLMKYHVQLSEELENTWEVLPKTITKHQPLKTLV